MDRSQRSAVAQGRQAAVPRPVAIHCCWRPLARSGRDRCRYSSIPVEFTRMTAIPAEKLDKLGAALGGDPGRAQPWRQSGEPTLRWRRSSPNSIRWSRPSASCARCKPSAIELAELLTDPAADEELAAIARDELAALEPRLRRCSSRPARAAAAEGRRRRKERHPGGARRHRRRRGGLFAADLFRMYAAMPSSAAGRSRSSASRRTISAATRRSWRRSRARVYLPA